MHSSGVLRQPERCNCLREERRRSCSPISHEAHGEARLMKWSWRPTLTTHIVLSGSCNSSSCRRKNRGIPRERILERVVAQIVNMSEHTQSDGEDRQRFAISRSKLRTHRMQAVRDHQEHRAEKESDRRTEHQSGEQTKGEFDPEPAHQTS